MNFAWEPLGDGVTRCRLPFLDVSVGVVQGSGGTLLIDTSTTLTEAQAIDQGVRYLTRRFVTHIVLTHNHFDHILGSSAFAGAAVYSAPEHQVRDAVVDIGDRLVSIHHPGRGHTDHDLIVSVADRTRTIVFCGDLVEESGDPVVDSKSDVGGLADHIGSRPGSRWARRHFRARPRSRRCRFCAPPSALAAQSSVTNLRLGM